MLYKPIVVKVRHFGSILNFQYIFSPHSARFVFHPCPLCVPASPACPFFPCSVAPPPHLSRPSTSTARPASIACIVRPTPPCPALYTPKIRELTVCHIPHSVRAQHPIFVAFICKKISYSGKMLPKCRTSPSFFSFRKMLPKCRTSSVTPPENMLPKCRSSPKSSSERCYQSVVLHPIFVLQKQIHEGASAGSAVPPGLRQTMTQPILYHQRYYFKSDFLIF